VNLKHDVTCNTTLTNGMLLLQKLCAAEVENILYFCFVFFYMIEYSVQNAIISTISKLRTF